MKPEELELIETLSEREYDVFLNLGEGLTTHQIAKIPGKYCSVKTVETYCDKLKKKLKQENIWKLRKIAVLFLAYKEANNLTRAPKLLKIRYKLCPTTSPLLAP